MFRSRHRFTLLGCVCFWKWKAVRSGETLVETVCLGRPFKLGMLYASFNDSLFPYDGKKTFWTHWNIKKYTTTRENTSINYDVITDDSLSSKLRHLGVKSGHLALNLLSGLVKTTSARSVDYLKDTIVSNRQIRVVLKYQCVTKYKELNMPWFHCFSKACIFSPDQVVATHVVVGVEYGAEAYFVFDKDLGNSEDYQETRRLMESLISYLPDLKEKREH
uniref:SNTX MACPF/CDC-like domain-containing protein n=1 Tax=Amphimedon queenslandica TaxID=400682 RepID=A0A1X7SNN7_AMPQE